MMLLAINITEQEWQQFQCAAAALAPSVVNDEDDSKLYAAIVLRSAVMEVISQWLKTVGPYQVLGSKEVGWHVYYVENKDNPRLADTENPNKPHKDYSNAKRKARTFNRKWNLAMLETEENMKQNGVPTEYEGIDIPLYSSQY